MTAVLCALNEITWFFCYGIRPDICLLLKIRPNSGLILKIRPNACRHSTNRLKPNTQRKTELNWTVQFSSVEFSSVSAQSAVQWTGVDELRRPSQVLDRQEPATAVDKLATAVASRRSASLVVVQRQTLRWLADSQVCPDYYYYYY